MWLKKWRKCRQNPRMHWLIMGSLLRNHFKKLLKQVCHSIICALISRLIHNGQEVVITIQSSGCRHQVMEINYLEHVEIVLTMDYSKRGALHINLTSPMGTWNHKENKPVLRCLCHWEDTISIFPLPLTHSSKHLTSALEIDNNLADMGE